jgi:hypothetical protein
MTSSHMGVLLLLCSSTYKSLVLLTYVVRCCVFLLSATYRNYHHRQFQMTGVYRRKLDYV